MLASNRSATASRRTLKRDERGACFFLHQEPSRPIPRVVKSAAAESVEPAFIVQAGVAGSRQQDDHSLQGPDDAKAIVDYLVRTKGNDKARDARAQQ